MIDINIFTSLFTNFYFGKWLVIGATVYGLMNLIKMILRRG